MKVLRLELGPLAANCHLVWAPEAAAAAAGPRPCLVIDPGAEPERILAALGRERLRPELIVATHCHGDHIGAVDALLAAFPEAGFAVGQAERDWPASPARNLSYGFGLPLRARAPDRLLADGQTLRAGGLDFTVLAVPGHSPGSVALYCAAGPAVFTGDALFAQEIGRADLPGGDERQLVASIREKLFALPEETVVWPGHASRTRIGVEKRTNPWVGVLPDDRS